VLFTLVALDPTRFFYCTYDDEPPEAHHPFGVYLFQVDVAQLQCTIMDEHKLNGFYSDIYVDSTNPCKFLLCYMDNEYADYARRGCLTDNGKLEFNDEQLDLSIEIPGKNIVPCPSSYNYSGKNLKHFPNIL
jgi:hypothetical protein